MGGHEIHINPKKKSVTFKCRFETTKMSPLELINLDVMIIFVKAHTYSPYLNETTIEKRMT